MEEGRVKIRYHNGERVNSAICYYATADKLEGRANQQVTF